MDFTKKNIQWAVSFALAVFLVGGYQILFAAPTKFLSGSIVNIASGSSVSIVAGQLANAHIIANPSLLRFVLRLSGKSTGVQSGVYRFMVPQNLFAVAARLVAGEYGLQTARLTFPEGITVREMATKVAEALPGVKAEDFLKEAQPYEGYLFPDTYFFTPSSDVASIVALMRANFNKKIATTTGELQISGRSLSDTVILASLIEKEARTSENRRIIAGILYNRLKIGMPLQVDAVFGYIFGRDTYSPSLSDLNVDSPFNTYKHTGLPPGPIGNPGLDSISAASNPTKTDYLYYLTGKDGLMHYATTYDGHQANHRKYLQ